MPGKAEGLFQSWDTCSSRRPDLFLCACLFSILSRHKDTEPVQTVRINPFSLKRGRSLARRSLGTSLPGFLGQSPDFSGPLPEKLRFFGQPSEGGWQIFSGVLYYRGDWPWLHVKAVNSVPQSQKEHAHVCDMRAYTIANTILLCGRSWFQSTPQSHTRPR